MQFSSRNLDVFGTYLKEIGGDPAVDRVLEAIGGDAWPVSKLAVQMGLSPSVLVDALLSGERSGVLKLTKEGDRTLVTRTTLAKSPS